jgi:hypothetical protein
MPEGLWSAFRSAVQRFALAASAIKRDRCALKTRDKRGAVRSKSTL